MPVLDLDQVIDDVIWDMEARERRRRMVMKQCVHCHRRMKAMPDDRPLCAGCAIRAGHTAEERLLRAIMGEPEPCGRCRETCFTIDEARAYIESCVMMLGLAFHVDTRGAEYYVLRDGKRMLSDSQAIEWDHKMDLAYRAFAAADQDIYAFALELMIKKAADALSLL